MNYIDDTAKALNAYICEGL